MPRCAPELENQLYTKREQIDAYGGATLARRALVLRQPPTWFCSREDWLVHACSAAPATHGARRATCSCSRVPLSAPTRPRGRGAAATESWVTLAAHMPLALWTSCLPLTSNSRQRGGVFGSSHGSRLSFVASQPAAPRQVPAPPLALPMPCETRHAPLASHSSKLHASIAGSVHGSSAAAVGVVSVVSTGVLTSEKSAAKLYEVQLWLPTMVIGSWSKIQLLPTVGSRVTRCLSALPPPRPAPTSTLKLPLWSQK